MRQSNGHYILQLNPATETGGLWTIWLYGKANGNYQMATCSLPNFKIKLFKLENYQTPSV